MKLIDALTFTPCLNEHEEAWRTNGKVAPVIERIHRCVAACGWINIGCIHYVMFHEDVVWKLKNLKIKKNTVASYELWMWIWSVLDDVKRIRIKGNMRWDNGSTYCVRNDEGGFDNQDVRELRSIEHEIKTDWRFPENFRSILIELLQVSIGIIEDRSVDLEKQFDSLFIRTKVFFNEAMSRIMAEVNKKQ